MRRAREAPISFPEVLFVTLSDADDTERFVQARWPKARAIADDGKILRHAFGVRRGGVREFMAPDVWVATARSLLKGNGIGKPQGDVLEMPGMVLLTQDEILWEQVFKHAGSRPDFRGLLDAMSEWRTRPQPPETKTSAPASGGVSSSSASR